MKVTKRLNDETVVVVEEKRPKIGLDHEQGLEEGTGQDYLKCEEEPMEASGVEESAPTRCPICLWPSDSPQCYHKN
jgi:hypothetical protein